MRRICNWIVCAFVYLMIRAVMLLMGKACETCVEPRAVVVTHVAEEEFYALEWTFATFTSRGWEIPDWLANWHLRVVYNNETGSTTVPADLMEAL